MSTITTTVGNCKDEIALRFVKCSNDNTNDDNDNNGGGAIIYKGPLFSLCAMTNQGGRPYMEDRISVLSSNGISIFSIFDGHVGDRVAHHMSTYFVPFLHKFIVDCIEGNCIYPPDKILDGVQMLVLEYDAMYHKNNPNEYSGSTMTTLIIIHPNTKYNPSNHEANIMFINVGDSITMWMGDDVVKFFTAPHEPGNEEELQRIKSVGSFVDHAGTPKLRVEGNLAVARSLGDYGFKEKFDWINYYKDGNPKHLLNAAVSALPDVNMINISTTGGVDNLFILTSDGVVEEGNHTVEDVRKKYQLHDGGDLKKPTLELVRESMKKSQDNISIIAIRLS